MPAVHIPLLLTLPDLSDMSHPSLPSLLTPQQESNPNGLLKQRQFPNKLLTLWKLVFQLSPQNENLEFYLLSTRTKTGHSRLDHWHTSPCAQQWEEHHTEEVEKSDQTIPLLLALCVSGDSKILSSILVLTSSDVNFLCHE